MPNWRARRISEFTGGERQRRLASRVTRQEGRSITGPAQAANRPRQFFAADNGVVPDGTTDSAAAIAAIIQRMRAGDELILEAGNVRANATIVVDRGIVLRGDATLTTGNTSAPQIRVTATASRATIEGIALAGVGAGTYRAASYGILLDGTSRSSMVEGVELRGVRFLDQAGHAFWANYSKSVKITDCRVERFARDAFMFLSAEDAWVERSYAADASMAAGSLAYGVAFTRDTTKPLDEAPQSINFHVYDSEFRNIGWEGIDTHAGQHGHIRGNSLYNCLQPIAIVSGHDQVGASGGAYGPKHVTVENNYMESGVSDGTRRAGIVVQGAGPLTAGSVLDPATGCRVVGNTVIGHGLENTSNQGGILAVRTDRLTIEDNDLDQCSVCGIVMQNDNRAFVVADNRIRDVWSANTNFRPPAVGCTSFYNVGYITGTSTSRGSKVAARVNERGIYVATHTSNVIDLGKNPLRDVVTRTVGVTE